MPDEKLRETEGVIFGCQRFSIHDGPGIRTCIFFKGCNLHCAWCHNPESLSHKPALSYSQAKCIGCNSCTTVCPTGAHNKIIGEKHIYDRVPCTVCGKCANICPAAALTVIGKRVNAEKLLKIVKRDNIYYENGGGVTLSGGEALLQLDLAVALLTLCRNEKIHNAVETHGMHPFSTYEKVMPLVDLFLFDYKMTAPDKLKKYTGADKALVMENLKKLHDAGMKVLLRCPIIIGLNDNEEHFYKIAQLTNHLPNLMGAEILPYHSLGISKSEHIGMKQEEFKSPEPETVKEWKNTIIGFGGRLVNID